MKTTSPVDAARIELLLSDLRLPAIKLMWAKLAEQSDKEGWPAARFLAALAEHEIADRGRRRIERHLAEARLPVGKTLASFDFKVVPMVSKAQVMALTAGDSWLEKGANLLLFGPPRGLQKTESQVGDCQARPALPKSGVYRNADGFWRRVRRCRQPTCQQIDHPYPGSGRRARARDHQRTDNCL